jgi:hypothetical protein
MVGQLEFPIMKLKSWRMFNTWSMYLEYQLWFIPSEISPRVVNLLSFGARVGLF